MTAPFRLAPGVSFTHDSNGGTIKLSYPQRMIKLSQAGTKALHALCDQESAGKAEMAPLAAFAEDLENQGILARNFPPLAEDDLPSVSIVIPTYRRSELLTHCLDSIRELDYPLERLEVVVVDDGSPQAVELGAKFRGVKVVRLPQNSGPGVARNAAVRLAQGEIIAFLDDDCRAARGWLRALVPCFRFPDVGVAGGRVASDDLTYSLQKYEQVQSPLNMGDQQRKVRNGSSLSYLATCNLLVRKETLLSVGGFDPALRVGEDVDLCRRILESKKNIYYIPEGLIFHHHRFHLAPFLFRRFAYGRSEVELQARFPRDKRRLLYYPGNGVVTMAALATFIMSGSLRGPMVGTITGISAALVLTIFNLFWQTARRQRSINLPEIGYRTVLLAQAKSQKTALYLFGRHYSRYYSLTVTILALLIHPALAGLSLAIHVWPAVVDYRLKQPDLGWTSFISFYSAENLFYQAGVLMGCLLRRNWRPLAMDIVRATPEIYWENRGTRFDARCSSECIPSLPR